VAGEKAAGGIGVKEKDVYTSDIDVTNVITGILESKEEFTK